MRAIVHLLIVASLFALTSSSRADNPSPFSVTRLDGRLVIRREDSPVAEFLFDDPTVRRPCFANVHAARR